MRSGTGLLPTSLKLRRAGSVTLIIIGLIAYAFLKRANLNLSAGDQWVYFAASHLFADGILPYRDFFFSHGPLQILLSTLLVKIGASIPVLSLLPALIYGMSALTLFSLVRERMGTVRALLAFLLFLFSYANLMGSLYYTGQELGLLLFLLGFLFFLRRKKLTAGLLVGLSVCASINMLVTAFVLTIFQFFWNKKKLPALLSGMAGSFGVIHLIFTVIAGSAFWKQVYLYHLAKPDESVRLAGSGKVFLFMGNAHGLLLILALAGAVLLWSGWRRGSYEPERQKLLLLSCALTIAQILFLALIHPIFPHYFVPIAPFIAILGAEALIFGSEYVLKKWKGRDFIRSAVPAVIILVLLAWNTVHTLRFYRIEQILLGVPHAREVAAVVRESVPEDATIFGEFGIAPLISLLSGRRLAGNEVDTSEMRIFSGETTLDAFIKIIEEDNVQILVNRELRGINAYPPFWKYRDRHFFLARTFKASGYPTVIELWKRK